MIHKYIYTNNQRATIRFLTVIFLLPTIYGCCGFVYICGYVASLRSPPFVIKAERETAHHASRTCFLFGVLAHSGPEASFRVLISNCMCAPNIYGIHNKLLFYDGWKTFVHIVGAGQFIVLTKIVWLFEWILRTLRFSCACLCMVSMMSFIR